MMSVESIRGFSFFPPCDEKLQWGEGSLFQGRRKIFALLSLSSVPPRLMFKCEPGKFAELVELEDIIPAPLSGPLQVGSTAAPRCPALERHRGPDYKVV